MRWKRLSSGSSPTSITKTAVHVSCGHPCSLQPSPESWFAKTRMTNPHSSYLGGLPPSEVHPTATRQLVRPKSQQCRHWYCDERFNNCRPKALELLQRPSR